MARPSKPYHVKDNNQPVPGLSRGKDGRWRYQDNGKDVKFTEPNEARAVQRYLRATAQATAIEVPIAVATRGKKGSFKKACYAAIQNRTDARPKLPRPDESSGSGRANASVPPPIQSILNSARVKGDVIELDHVRIDEEALIHTIHVLAKDRPDILSEALGVPMSTLDNLPAKQGGTSRIEAVRAAYRENSQGSGKSIREALASFDDLVAFTGAQRLEDLTEAQLARWSKSLKEAKPRKTPQTIGAYINRIRSVLSIARRGEVDLESLDAALSRCRAKLHAPVVLNRNDPKPISREAFHGLHGAAAEAGSNREIWRAMLLLVLNAALYMEDLCSLEWKNLDLENGVYHAHRKKRGLVLRVATLWPETVEALKALPRRGGSSFVFTSNRGTRFNRNTKINQFRKLADEAGQHDVTFSHLRDGAYTSALAPGVSERAARLLAGHASPGLMDRYVKRHSEDVRPACDAVYAAYGPFPELTETS